MYETKESVGEITKLQSWACKIRDNVHSNTMKNQEFVDSLQVRALGPAF